MNNEQRLLAPGVRTRRFALYVNIFTVPTYLFHVCKLIECFLQFSVVVSLLVLTTYLP